jgi:hypothetical protein
MSLDLNIYTKSLSADLISKIQHRFLDFRMEISFHPDFKFDEKADTGFLPIKLKVLPGVSRNYDSLNYEIMTGFELLYDDYNYEEELKELADPIPKSASFFLSLFKRKGQAEPARNFVASKEIDDLLKYCKKDIMISWQSSNKSELRVSLFFAGILAELTHGVIYDPQKGRYLNAQQALNTFPAEIAEYENSIPADQFTVDKFEKWL